MSVEMPSGVLVANMLEGMRFALGPTMATRKDVLNSIGGITALSQYCADDYVLGYLTYAAGKRVVLSHHVIDHVAMNTSLRASLGHQVRWMRSTRFSRRWGHVGTGLTYATPFGLLGLAAGYFHARVDWTIMTLVNVMLTFPFVLLALAVIAVLGPSLLNMIIVLGIADLPLYARVVRAETLAIREREFIMAGRALGMSHPRIIFRQILPNLVSLIVVIATLQVARVIILESSSRRPRRGETCSGRAACTCSTRGGSRPSRGSRSSSPRWRSISWATRCGTGSIPT